MLKQLPLLWDKILQYYKVPIKDDLVIPVGSNPAWHKMQERIFTVILRLSFTLGMLDLLFTGPDLLKHSLSTFISFLIVLVLLGGLGLKRNIRHERRVAVLLFLLYCLSFVEMLNFGYSVESFTFFMAFIVFSGVLTARRGAIHALTGALLTMGGFGVLIGTRLFIPLTTAAENGAIFPDTLMSALTSLLVFAASSIAVFSSIVILLENVNTAWQKETQALSLLQQEHDLLEQRVEERTRDLAEARDQAVAINHQQRKYFRAIEQSGNIIVITDVSGAIEYVNPKFEQSTGYSLAEAIGKNPRILKSGRQPKEFYSELWQTISSGKVWKGEFLNQHKDGSLHWESATIAPVMDDDGVVTNYVAVKEDITAQRQSDEQLRKLWQAVEQSGNTVIMLDRAGMMEYVNPKFSEVTGYTPQEAIGKSPMALMNGLEREPDFSHDDWWLMVNRGETWRGEFHNHRKDGSVFWESATIAPVLNRDGGIINFLEIKQDITEQKILQEQLQNQNDYLSILHQVTLDLLDRRDLADLLKAIVDRSAALLDAPVSEMMLERDGLLVVEAISDDRFGLKGERVTYQEAKISWKAFDSHQPVVLEDYSQSEFKRPIYDANAIHATADFPVMVGERCLGVLALGRLQAGYPFTPEQIQTGILFARLAALVLDNASLYQSALTEIAERKRAEALLQESETRFRQIVENASDLIYRTDIHGNFTYANPAALKLMGFTSEQEMLGRNYLELVAPEFRHRVERIYRHQYVSGTNSAYREFPAINAGGQVVWVGQNVQLIRSGDEVVGFQAVARDITELKNALDALAISRDQALEGSRLKGQLLSRVSHELRTPLNGVLGYAELLSYNTFGDLNAEQREAVESIMESSSYLTHIVNDLLDEAQIESRSLSLHNVVFPLAELIGRVKAPISMLANKKGLDLRFEVDPNLPSELYGDIDRLQQIIMNLTGNAVKFTKEGEVVVCMKRPTPAHWVISVRDSGIGIPAEEWQNIFEPFRQVDSSISRENRGSGLGLAIVRQLVELMQGEITLQSELGKGSLFTITLPIIKARGE
jgi:PAS domain S-box-containing protein